VDETIFAETGHNSDATVPDANDEAADDLTWDTARHLLSAYSEHGGGLFILDIERFTSNYRRFLDAFRRLYERCNIAYSYKTNYTPRLCEVVNALGGYAEVVSGMEYELALRVGVLPTRIIFNGPYKAEAEVERALIAGATVNLDSLDEARMVAAIARRVPERSLSVGIRCNFDLGTARPSRFGVDVDGGGVDATLALLEPLHNCHVNGFHCHFSTERRTVESFARRARGLIELSSRYVGRLQPRFLNVGGGFFSNVPAALRAQLAVDAPTYEQYAQAVASGFAAQFAGNSAPELILEPGVALTADVMRFVAVVVAIKRVRSRQLAVVSGSVHNIKPTLHGFNLPMRVLSHHDEASDRVTGPIDVVGYTCMEHDCLYTDFPGSLATGDYVVFDNVGAYTIVMKPPFIHPSAPIIGYDSTTKAVDVLRRAETFNDVFATYRFRGRSC
jgi:diaminopimelate decarboxylase